MVADAVKEAVLFSSLELCSNVLKHRIVMAPTTRMRNKEVKPGIFAPYELNVQYYSQRATNGGLIITEATDISRYASGYRGVSGAWSDEQIAGWKKVTTAVHEKGGTIYCQLWHVGRGCVSQQIDGQTPVSSTATPIQGASLVEGVAFTDSPPRPLSKDEIPGIINDWVHASKRCVEDAGFDGVEIHSGNGYLLEQFLHDNVNDRTDEYGGSISNRARFTLELIRAVSEAIGSNRTAVRLSPYNYYLDTRDSNPNEVWTYISEQIVKMGTETGKYLSYVHFIEPRFDEVLDEKDKIVSLDKNSKCDEISLNVFRKIFLGTKIKFIAAGAFNYESAVEKLHSNEADLIAFGRLFISTPDLVERFKLGLPPNKYDRPTFYGANPPETGYTDYPYYTQKLAKSIQ